MRDTFELSGMEVLTPTPGHVSTDHGSEFSSDFRFVVIVVATTTEGTIASLRAAGSLAAELCARIDLVATEPVSIRFPLETPPVAVDVLVQQMNSIVKASGVPADQVTLRLWLCRDRNATLDAVLPARSIVIIGGKGRWWCWRERALLKFLDRLGHQVVFAEVTANHHLQAWWQGLFSPVPQSASAAIVPRQPKGQR